MDRRAFLSSTIALGAGGSWAFAASDEAEWSLPVLGDLHIDKPSHHDMEWLKAHHPNDVRQVENYSRVTSEFTGKLLKVCRDLAVESKNPVPFALQLGDLVEGLCGSEALAKTQAEDALAMVKGASFGMPFLFTKGNHDVTGPGAATVYDRLLVPFMATQANQKITAARFSRPQGGTLVVFYDAYDRGSLEWFEGVLKERKPGRLIFVIHPPVVPYTARSTWHIYSSEKQARERDRLLNLLGDARAVVLCGHLHKFGFLVRRTEKGKFTQLAISSVATDAESAAKNLVEGLASYGPDLVLFEPKHAPETLEARQAILRAEQPFIEEFSFAETWGHARLQVRGREVKAEIFRGLSRTPWKSIDLTGPLA